MTRDWYEAKIFIEDDEVDVECLVDTHAERDPYGTGDSPTMYEINVIKVYKDGDLYETSNQQEEDIIEQVLEELGDGARY